MSKSTAGAAARRDPGASGPPEPISPAAAAPPTSCVYCGSKYFAPKGHMKSGARRFKCKAKACGRRWSVQLNGAEISVASVKPKVEFSEKIGRRRIIVWTSAQNATPIHEGFKRALEGYCQKRTARLAVIPFRYRNPTSLWSANQEHDEWWDPSIVKYLYAGREVICKNLMALGDIRVQPTMKSPLSSFDTLTKHRSGIVGHPKLALVSVPTPHHSLPKLMMTTGALTVQNYTDSAIGKHGEHHHTFAALVTEIDGDEFHVRQMVACDDGSFIDLDTEYLPDGSWRPAPQPEALVMGDTHVDFVAHYVDKATFGPGGINDVLRPKLLVWHDLLDFFSRNHHEIRNPLQNIAKHRSGMDDVAGEVRRAIAFMERRTHEWQSSLVVPSNHNDALTRWILEADWKADPKNAEFYLETALAMARVADVVGGAVHGLDPLAYWAKRWMHPDVQKRVRFIARDDSVSILDVELAMHGDVGSNGARGSLLGLSRIGVKSIIGHSHTPGIRDGAYQVGTSSWLKLPYMRGPSSWLNTHCVLYANGKRSLITILPNGKWRASR